MLVNNAGISPLPGFDLCMKVSELELGARENTDILKVNLEGVLHGCNIFEEKLGQHNGGPGGLVVNTASIAGLVYGFNQNM